jgi:hypothetical protein
MRIDRHPQLAKNNFRSLVLLLPFEKVEEEKEKEKLVKESMPVSCLSTMLSMRIIIVEILFRLQRIRYETMPYEYK